ncbi:hypothetical protein [Methanolacinia paynteri]|uniref:hypothetical protein n=1 Tax=Methanolacinia paynteri TaxID=230356 RepID=UPI00064F050A|nr:hypothetical protein [Methanolacinia paynteri]
MKTKFGMQALILLLVVALAGAIFVPVVSADEKEQIVDNNDIVALFEPLNDEIVSKMAETVTTNGLAKTDFNSDKYSEELMKKYQKNLDLIIDSLKKETGKELSEEQSEDLKRIIVQEHIERVAWDEFKKKMGVKDDDFRALTPTKIDPMTQNVKSLPLSLILIQVEDDVTGGIGIDGSGLPYEVRGDNVLLEVSVDTVYNGKDLYECLFSDEDAPNPDLDLSYDALRLAIYHTLNDRQGFFIYDPDSLGDRDIEFGNDYDNGYSYAETYGQHGALVTSWDVGDEIYISNVWNHAMSLDDRNSNMDKIPHYYS